jgi:hypothetical protein
MLTTAETALSHSSLEKWSANVCKKPEQVKLTDKEILLLEAIKAGGKLVVSLFLF